MDDLYPWHLTRHGFDPPDGGPVRRHAGNIDGAVVSAHLHLGGPRGRIGANRAGYRACHVVVRDELAVDLHDARHRSDDPRHLLRLGLVRHVSPQRHHLILDIDRDGALKSPQRRVRHQLVRKRLLDVPIGRKGRQSRPFAFRKICDDAVRAGLAHSLDRKQPKVGLSATGDHQPRYGARGSVKAH